MGERTKADKLREVQESLKQRGLPDSSVKKSSPPDEPKKSGRY